MALSDDLTAIALICKTSAHQTLNLILSLGPKPDDSSKALLWDQQMTRLQGQLNSLSALVSKLTALSVAEGLKDYANDINAVATITRKAEAHIQQLNDVSDSLTKFAKILDLGLSILAAASAPSPATAEAILITGTAVANAFCDCHNK